MASSGSTSPNVARDEPMHPSPAGQTRCRYLIGRSTDTSRPPRIASLFAVVQRVTLCPGNISAGPEAQQRSFKRIDVPAGNLRMVRNILVVQ